MLFGIQLFSKLSHGKCTFLRCCKRCRSGDSQIQTPRNIHSQQWRFKCSFRITDRAIETFARPTKGLRDLELYSFEKPSSMECAFTNRHDQFHSNYLLI